MPAGTRRAKTAPGTARTAAISGDNQDEGPEALRAALAEAETERAEREREIAELRSLNRHLEARAITAHRTLAYGLGKALIEARSPRGMLALPGKIRRLRLKQKAKRRARVPEGGVAAAAARLRFVDEALERRARQGAEEAAGWIEALPEKDRPAKARAMTELAIAIVGERSDLAASLGERAAALDASEPRLLALALALRGEGLVAAPAAIGAAIRGAQLFNEAQADALARIAEDSQILAQGHHDTQLREVAITQARRDDILIVRAASDRLDHRVARTAAIAEANGMAHREIEMATFALDPTEPPPRLVHILASELAATRRALTVARLAGAPALLDFGAISDEAEGSGEMAEVARARLSWLAATANAVVARGDALADALEAAAGCAASVIPNQFELARGDPATAEIEFGLAPGSRIVACVASLDDPGVERLLEACASLARADATLHLAFFGRGRIMQPLAARAARLGVGERAHFLGLPLAMRWPDLFARFDLAVFPGERPLAEGSGLETAMAVGLASGCKVIASPEAWRWSAMAPGMALPDEAAGWGEAIGQALTAKGLAPRPVVSDDGLASLHRALAALP